MRTDRVLGLARVWAKAKFFHPHLAYKDIDWDGALVAAIPEVEAAASDGAFREAVQWMLARIGDPLTGVVETPIEQVPPTVPADWLTTPAPGIVHVAIAGLIGAGFDPMGLYLRGREVVAAAATMQALVVDLRAPGSDPWLRTEAIATFVDILPAIDEWPLRRAVEHRGFRTQVGRTSGEYHSMFVTTGALPPKPAPAVGPAHVVFLTDGSTSLPDAVLALQATGRATLVAAGGLGTDGSESADLVELPGGGSARIRLSEPLWGSPAADVTVPDGDDPTARAIGIAQERSDGAPAPREPVVLPQLRARDDADHADLPFPGRELRLLAGVRIWAVLDLFFPYRHLIDGDWDATLCETLPELAAAADAEQYVDVLRGMAVRAGDGHIGIWAADRETAAPPFELRLVEGELAVVALTDPAAAAELGIAVGDVIETIDGTPTAAVLATRRTKVSGSTVEARDQRTAQYALNGPADTTVQLGVRGAEFTVPRGAHAAATGPHWELLPDGIGYADLRALTVPEVEPMFADLATTRAIVFDMRGYPNGTAWAIVPRVNTRGATHGAQFLQPLVTGGEGGTDRRIHFLQPLPPSEEPIYRGKVVVLIDDRAISQAEHTCLFLEAAAGATFVGSPTHGANGDVTLLRLPGGLRMSFTGQEVRHVDGRQLQRIGIQPDVPVRPTLAGIRAGRDEVLERALEWLRPA